MIIDLMQKIIDLHTNKYFSDYLVDYNKSKGRSTKRECLIQSKFHIRLIQDSNPRPLAPEARIIPLDQAAMHFIFSARDLSSVHTLNFCMATVNGCTGNWQIAVAMGKKHNGVGTAFSVRMYPTPFM